MKTYLGFPVLSIKEPAPPDSEDHTTLTWAAQQWRKVEASDMEAGGNV